MPSEKRLLQQCIIKRGVKNYCRHCLSQTTSCSVINSSGSRLFFPLKSSWQQQKFRFQSSSSNRLHATPLPKQYLNAYDPQKFDPSTHQRNDVLFDPIHGKPQTDSSTPHEQEKKKDNSLYKFDESWLGAHLDRWRADPSDFDSTWPVTTDYASDAMAKCNTATKRILWSNWTEDLVRDKGDSPILFEYDSIFHNKRGKNMTEKRVLKALYQYGLVLITGTPTATDSLPQAVMTEATKKVVNSTESAEEAILHLASMIGYHPLQTLYGGGVWSTSSYSSFYSNNDNDGKVIASTADSAYGSTSLPLHTDLTYMSNPPGVQIFVMVQPATAARTPTTTPKGQSVYLDGFAAAERLRIENPDAFHILASTQRRYRCIDEKEGWHLESCGPIIKAIQRDDGGWGPVTCIRHNDLDRLPDLPPYPSRTDDFDFASFYDKLRDAHVAWDDILRRDEMRLVIDLKCGDCVLVSNQRCMHGRYAFDSSQFPRIVMGCYVGMDELRSKWRRQAAFSFP
jgi:trimethyllysine dioxygenase